MILSKKNIGILALFSFLISFSLFVNGKTKIVYKYRKYQKVNIDGIDVAGDYGNPGDLSVIPLRGRNFENKLPYRKNFNREIRLGIERIR